MRIRVPFKVSLCLVVRIEVVLGVRAPVVLLQVLLRDEKLRTLLAFVELRALFSRQLQQVFVCAERFLLQSQLFLENLILCLLLLNSVSYSRCLFIRLLVVEVQGLGQRLQVVLSVDQILDRHLRQSEQLNEVGITDAL